MLGLTLTSESFNVNRQIVINDFDGLLTSKCISNRPHESQCFFYDRNVCVTNVHWQTSFTNRVLYEAVKLTNYLRTKKKCFLNVDNRLKEWRLPMKKRNPLTETHFWNEAELRGSGFNCANLNSFEIFVIVFILEFRRKKMFFSSPAISLKPTKSVSSLRNTTNLFH